MRLGSLTQGVRQPAQRLGMNVVPMCGQGFCKFVDDQSTPENLRRLRFSTAGIGHYAAQPFGWSLLKPQFLGSFVISGVTRDNTGAPLGNCDVDLFRNDAMRTWIARTTSDGSGNFSFSVSDNATTYFCRFYKSGAPNRAGTTDNAVIAA